MLGGWVGSSFRVFREYQEVGSRSAHYVTRRKSRVDIGRVSQDGNCLSRQENDAARIDERGSRRPEAEVLRSAVDHRCHLYKMVGWSLGWFIGPFDSLIIDKTARIVSLS